MKYLRKYHSLFSLFLLMGFVQAVAPHEWLHDLISQHHDTADSPFSEVNSKYNFVEKHHHCDYLQLFLPDFESADVEVNSFQQNFGDAPIAVFISTHSTSTHFHFSSRGPPTV